MLGAEPDKVTLLKRELAKKEAELEAAYEAIKDLEALDYTDEDEDFLDDTLSDECDFADQEEEADENE